MGVILALCIAFVGYSALTLWPTEYPTGSKLLKDGRICFPLMVGCVQSTWEGMVVGVAHSCGSRRLLAHMEVDQELRTGQEVRSGYKASRPASSDLLPPIRSHLLLSVL